MVVCGDTVQQAAVSASLLEVVACPEVLESPVELVREDCTITDAVLSQVFCSPAHVAMRRVFGWTKKNEIGNGRWVMFGFAVGLLTEYATGVDFIDQLKMIVSFLGIADVE